MSHEQHSQRVRTDMESEGLDVEQEPTLIMWFHKTEHIRKYTQKIMNINVNLKGSC